MFGCVVVLSLLIMMLGTLCEALSKLKKRRLDAELNHDMREMFPSAPSQVVALRAEARGSLLKFLEAVCRTWRRITRRH